MKQIYSFLTAFVMFFGVMMMGLVPGKSEAQISDQPDTPFKLATFEAAGTVRVGMAVQGRLMDLQEANAYVTKQLGLSAVSTPNEMRALIEQYDAISNRMYTIANYMGENNRVADKGLAFVFDEDEISFKAPIKYPYNLLAAAANYKSHAQEMASPSVDGLSGATTAASGGGQGGPPGGGQGGGDGRGGGGFSAAEVDIDNEDPHMFAKSPRSCIIDPGEPFYIPEGINIDWEAELAIIIAKPALNLTLEDARDYVFGYSIIYDVSRRGGTGRRPANRMFPGVNWFRGKSSDRGAPFGPYIVPKEFIRGDNLRIITRVNGVTKQDGNSKDMIYPEAHLIRFLTSVLTLYPGDVIATGTPDGVGSARNPPEFLKPGDVVEIEIEGIGTLVTPMEAESE
mgnify:CR=1 FL=1